MSISQILTYKWGQTVRYGPQAHSYHSKASNRGKKDKTQHKWTICTFRVDYHCKHAIALKKSNSVEKSEQARKAR